MELWVVHQFSSRNMVLAHEQYLAAASLTGRCRCPTGARSSVGGDIALLFLVRHRTRDKDKLTTVRVRASARASKAIAMRAPSLGR